MVKKTKRRKAKNRRLLITLLLIILIFSLNAFKNKSNTEQDIIEGEDKEFVKETTFKDNINIFNVLILGVDSNNLNNTKCRTDTIMVASLNLENNKASIISIPRDTRVKIKGRKYKDKINHAHVYGGVALTIDTVEELLNIPIHNYIKIDYKALEKVIDEIGGVHIDVPIDMKYSDPYADPPLYINLEKGPQILSGEKAIQFVRFRKGYKDQDIGRISSQQHFIRAVLEEISQPKNIIKIPKLIDILIENTETNLSKTQIVKYSLKGIKINSSEINMVTLPGTSKLYNGVWYYDVSQEDIEILISNL